jgi:hypothetical protein
MAITMVLAVGVDSSLLPAQDSLWNAAGFILMPVNSIREAISHFISGDFDIVLLGESLSMEQRERLTFLIRAFGSHIPVACIATSPTDCNSFADATLRCDTRLLVTGMEKLVANAKMRAAQAGVYSNAG